MRIYCGCCAGSIRSQQIGDLLAILGGVAPQDRTKNLNSFIPVDIVGAQRNRDSLGFERLQNCARVLALLRREIGVVQNPVIELAFFVLAAHQVDCSVDDLHHLFAAFQGTGIASTEEQETASEETSPEESALYEDSENVEEIATPESAQPASDSTIPLEESEYAQEVA